MKNEDIKLEVRVRSSCGANNARCNGKTASSTHSEAMAVENVAIKAIKVIADLHNAPEIANRPRDLKNHGGGIWTVTYKAK